MSLDPTRFKASDSNFVERLVTLTDWELVSDVDRQARVSEIISDVRKRGDQAVLELTQKLDRNPATEISQLILSADELEHSYDALSNDVRGALEVACNRIWAFHEAQRESSWRLPEKDPGITLGQEVRPMQRVGLYVPGGKAAYPSSVLMNAIPAKVAGVPLVQMVVPAPGGELSSVVLAAAHLAKVDRVITIGGAQAVAALAYGTESVTGVDKIVGPGNAWVATAKKQVFGKVGIDMIAGPSEVLIYVEPPMNPDWVAMDLFSQAEHDEEAQSILISSDADYLDLVIQAMNRLVPALERSEIITKSINHRCLVIEVVDRSEAVDVINRIAPEHLELCVDDPELMLPMIQNAGAIFMGRFTPEALGDYCAGPNHVLPTSGAARFASPLGVYDFIKRSSVIQCTAEGAKKIARVASTLARSEGLTAHAKSAEYRF